MVDQLLRAIAPFPSIRETGFMIDFCIWDHNLLKKPGFWFSPDRADIAGGRCPPYEYGKGGFPLRRYYGIMLTSPSPNGNGYYFCGTH